ncbi:protein FAR1-RELATED SEQUENCE 2-like [Olea europaea var. sylvestris]|uniref:protein FAR1-RELATED SEQUENCE 2-like n=1 Tax=Olea europaea var. sylvestris TaxID=158386 RepID=UPI000C1D3AFC|nr:protein FAR1-RELATED SEQUENCE 2-like [Olea europaea var. sylvestris]
MEQQFQSVYTIYKFNEALAEFTGNVYCDLISTSEGPSGTMYEVRQDVMGGGIKRKKTFVVSFDRQNCDIICSYHLFEFRGIICRHAIAVPIRCDVTLLPERYILRRWRKDVSRAHTRVAVNYDGLVSTPKQLRYGDMCRAFEEVADLAANDEGRACVIMEWIKLQRQDLMMSKKSGTGSNAISKHSFDHMDQCTDFQHHDSVTIRDPVASHTKGSPKKLRRKGLLESSSKKGKGSSAPNKGKRPSTRQRDTAESVVDI